MIKYVFLTFIFSMWSIAYYTHFIQAFQNDTMVVLGARLSRRSHSLRSFLAVFDNVNVDLWSVRGSTRRRSVRARVQTTADAFATFHASTSYRRMVLVDVPMTVPIRSDAVVQYVYNNETVATSWPRLDTWPETPLDSSAKALAWYRGHVITTSVRPP